MTLMACTPSSSERAASRCGSCPTTGTSSVCLPGPPATSTRMLPGSPVIGNRWSSGTVFIHCVHASSSKCRRNIDGRHAGAVVEVERHVVAREPVAREAVGVLGAEDHEELALADRRVVHAERRHRRRDLVEDELRVAVLLHVVHVVRALAAVHRDRARVRATPRLTAYPSHGDASRFSAAQNVYFAGWPWVAASPEPGRAPATCSSTSRTARPTVALARFPGPNAPTPDAKPGGVGDLAVHEHERVRPGASSR